MKSDPVERIELSPGIFAAVYNDESPGNPWEDWDGCVPVIAWDGRTLSRYRGTEEITPRSLATLLPLALFETAEGREKAWGCLTSELPREVGDGPSWFNPENATVEDWRELFLCECDEESEDCAREYFDALEGIAALAGIHAGRREARGSCQGDWAELLFIFTPDFLEVTGIAANDLFPAQLKKEFDDARDLWEAWAFGNVYGFRLENEDGELIDEDGSVWGFYGYNHEESGLLETARENMRYLIEEREREAQEAFNAACRDVVTVP